jgi:hypothetical protein
MRRSMAMASCASAASSVAERADPARLRRGAYYPAQCRWFADFDEKPSDLVIDLAAKSDSLVKLKAVP